MYRKGIGEWYDWATVHFEADGNDDAGGVYPSKLLCFFRIKGGRPTDNLVLVHSCQKQIKEGEEYSQLTQKWEREYQTRTGTPTTTLFPKCYVVSAESIERPEFVMENTPRLREHITAGIDSLTMILAKDPREHWATSFFGLCTPLSSETDEDSDE